METSIFMDLTKTPVTTDLEIPLGTTFPIWKELRDFVFEKYPKSVEEWHISVKKYGWSFRIKDKKRAKIYLSPREGFFWATMVFGQKATDQISISDISEHLKEEQLNSRVYVEGRLIRMKVNNNSLTGDIKKLIEFKLAF